MSSIPKILKLKDYVTLTGTCLGFIALICAVIGEWGFISLGFFLLSITLGTDLLDGYLARKMKTVNEMGKQLDSLSDSLTFGIAPALLTFRAFQTLTIMDVFLAIGSILFAFGAILRLARFNISEIPGYTGVPTPLSGLFLIMFYFANYFFTIGTGGDKLLFISTIIITILMILFAWFNITTYISYKEKDKTVYITFLISAPICPIIGIIGVINLIHENPIISIICCVVFVIGCIGELIFIFIGFLTKKRQKDNKN